MASFVRPLLRPPTSEHGRLKRSAFLCYSTTIIPVCAPLITTRPLSVLNTKSSHPSSDADSSTPGEVNQGGESIGFAKHSEFPESEANTAEDNFYADPDSSSDSPAQPQSGSAFMSSTDSLKTTIVTGEGDESSSEDEMMSDVLKLIGDDLESVQVETEAPSTGSLEDGENKEEGEDGNENESGVKGETEKRKKGSLLKGDEEDERIDDAHWYFVQVKPGCENHAATSIRNLAKSLDSDDILDVFVPMTTVMSLTKGGKSVLKDERYFPGYILVLMSMNRLSYGHILRVTHVQSFMSDSNADASKAGPFRCPPPVSDTEMSKVFERMRDDPTDKYTTVKTEAFPFKLGDRIRVTIGNLQGSVGKVVAITPELNSLRCSLMVYGREATEELKVGELEKYTDEMEQEDEERRKQEEEEEEMKAWKERRGRGNDRYDRRNPRDRGYASQSGRYDNMDERKQRGRTRVDSLLSNSNVNYKQASVASAADDLAALLADDADSSWDPLASEPPRRKQRKLPDQPGDGSDLSKDSDEFTDPLAYDNVEDDDADDDGFEAVNVDDGEDEFRDEEGFMGRDNDLRKDQPGGTPSSRQRSDKGGDARDDDLFAWLDDKDNFKTADKRKSKASDKKSADSLSEDELEQLLKTGDGIEDIWGAKDEDESDEDDMDDLSIEDELEDEDALKKRLRESANDDEEEVNDGVESLLKDIETAFPDDEGDNLTDLGKKPETSSSRSRKKVIGRKNDDDDDDDENDDDVDDLADDDIRLEDDLFGGALFKDIEEDDCVELDLDGSLQVDESQPEPSGKISEKSRMKLRKQKKGGMMSEADEDPYIMYSEERESLEGGDLDELLPPVVQFEGEESIRKIDLNDEPPPYGNNIDYDAVIAKERAAKERKKQGTSRRRSPGGRGGGGGGRRRKVRSDKD